MSTLVEKLPIWPVSMATGGALLLTGGTVWRTAKTKPARRAIDVKIGIPPVHMHSAFDWDEACRIIAHPSGHSRMLDPWHKIHNQPHPTPGDLHGARRPAPPCRQGGVDGLTPHGVGDSMLSSGRKSGRARKSSRKTWFRFQITMPAGPFPEDHQPSRPNFAMACHSVAGTESTSTTARSIDGQVNG